MRIGKGLHWNGWKKAAQKGPKRDPEPTRKGPGTTPYKPSMGPEGPLNRLVFVAYWVVKEHASIVTDGAARGGAVARTKSWKVAFFGQNRGKIFRIWFLGGCAPGASRGGDMPTRAGRAISARVRCFRPVRAWHHST